MITGEQTWLWCPVVVVMSYSDAARSCTGDGEFWLFVGGNVHHGDGHELRRL